VLMNDLSLLSDYHKTIITKTAMRLTLIIFSFTSAAESFK